MRERRAWLLRAALLVVLSGCALAARLHVALGSLTDPHPTSLPDDAFYDFGIARHLALGAGPTFDGFTPTNGFHPLWVALLVPIWRLAPLWDRLGPVHAAMVLGTVLDVASLVVLWRLCRIRLAFSLYATTLAVGWLALNPFQIMIATCGLEASLAQFLLLLLLDEELATRWQTTPRLRWSVIAGLALLARADLVIPIVVLLFARLRRCTPHVSSLAVNTRRIVVALSIAVAIYAPWIVYSRFTAGRWIQSSSVALPFSMAELPHVWGYETITRSERLRLSAFALLDAMVGTLASMGAGKWVAASLVGGGVVMLLLRRSTGIRRMSPYWVALVLLLLAHGAVRRVFREWYAFPFSAGYALLVGHALDSAVRRVRYPWVPAALAAAVVGAGIVLETHDRLQAGYFGVATLEAHVPPFTERSGYTDGGVWCYLAGGNRANLDGIVNWNALDALHTGTLLDYVEREHIRHFWMTERYRHPRFMGRRWRERIVVDPEGWRLATPEEKDRRIALTERVAVLGSESGGELLSDGWLWPEHPAQATARTVGRQSEIVFTIDDDRGDDAEIDLELANIELEDGTRCTRVKAELDGVPVGTIEVNPHLSWALIRPRALGRGRHRLVLRPNRYGVAKTASSWRQSGWRAIRENALTALDVRGLKVGPVGLVALLPEGPGLAGDPTDALLEEGWLPTDRGEGIQPAVWAAASSATLHFRANRGESRHLVIRGSAPPPANGQEGQEVDLELNGVSLGTLHYDGSQAEEREVTVPAGVLLQRRNELRLRFARRGSDPLGRAFYLFSVAWR